MITYQRETGGDDWLEKILSELQALSPAHWREFSYFPDAAGMNVNWDVYVKLHTLGWLHFISARRDGKLIGYHPFQVSRHQHRDPGVKYASDLVLYVVEMPGRVLVLNGLIRFSLDYMRELGVKIVVMRSKLDHDIAPLLKHYGLEPLETVYGKVLP